MELLTETAPTAAELPSAPATASSNTTAQLARFEFSDLGTKILMVEWHPSSSSVDPSATLPTPNDEPAAQFPTGTSTANKSVLEFGAWEVSWPGKSTFLPARETDHDDAGPRRRVYFLLPPEASMPTSVTITQRGRPSIVVKPLPAIFPPGFDVEPGTRGVLHTLWAKKRLSELEQEMKAEMRANAESVGLDMALAEKQWIIENFLRSSRAAAVPMSPRSPIPGRLGDKLKGLRLATSANDLLPSPTANTFTGIDAPSHTLSPSGDDVAVSSFSTHRHGNGPAEPISLGAALSGESAPLNVHPRDGEDDLFALPLSPRSPEMKRAPFSIL